MKGILLTLTLAALAGSSSLFAAEVPGAETGREPGLLPKLELKNSGAPAMHRALGKAPEIRKARVDLYSGRVMDGLMINSNEWADYSIVNVPYGLYKIDMGALTSSAVATDFTYDFMSAAYTPDEVIGVRVMSIMGIFNGVCVTSINPVTRQTNWENQISPDEGGGYNAVSSVMAYNPIDGELYAVNYNEDLTGLTLNLFSQEKRNFEPYANWTAKIQPLTMAFSPTGVCNVICNDGILYKLDLKTAQLTSVGDTGVRIALYTQAMTYDGVTGNFIWAAITEVGERLYAVDPETAEVEEIARFNHNEQLAALYLPMTTAFYGAPAAVQSIMWGGWNGALSGNVIFTLPNQTYGGAAYTGDVNYTLWIDGEAVAENVKSKASQYTSIPADLDNGSHFFAVSTTNNVGRSPLAYARYWVGPDYPVAPATVTLSTEGRNFKIDWTGVTQGQHDGYVDSYNLKYNVYRMPGNVLVGENVTGTTFTDPIPPEMMRYHYEVAAINSDGKEGARGLSNILLEGDAASVPYFEDFSNDSFLSLFRIVDNDGNGVNWNYTSWNYEMNASTYTGTEDNWLITPPIKFQASNKYQTILNMRTAFQNFPETLKVMLGKENMELSDFTEIGELKDAEILDFEDKTFDFSVPEDGDYEIAFVACSRGNNCSTIRLNSINVILLGDKNAPAEVNGLTITPGADDALTATVAFTVPTLNLGDNTLSSVSYAEIYVDDEFAAKVENITPGQKVSKVLENIPTVGKHKFTVGVANGSGMGKKIWDFAFIGCYGAPFSETFDNPSDIEFWTSEYNFEPNGLDPMTYSSYEQSLQMSYFATAENMSSWMFSPDFKLDGESVYTYSFDFKDQFYNADKYYLTIGRGAKSEGQVELMNLPTDSKYVFAPVTAEVVIIEPGKYNLGINVTNQAVNDYVMYSIDNVSLTYLTSAKAPYAVTDVKAVADKGGKLEADLTFTAPLVDFNKRTLSKINKIEIYRGDGMSPIATFDNPAPGVEIEWHDAKANYGVNSYIIVATNEAGRGKTYTQNLFVGEDVPAIENVKITSTPDNMRAILSWDRCEFGVNGGVLLDEDLSYTLLQYNTGSEEFEVVATGVKENSYTFEPVGEHSQVYYYYAVMPVNDVNAGSAHIYNIVLGDLYELPFVESFGNGIPTTALWSIESQNPYISWQPMSGLWDGYEFQDNDSGCVGFFNGNYYTNYAGDRLYSPKVTPAGWVDPTLSFWVLHAREAAADYPYPALMRVNISADDEEFVQISEDENLEFDGTMTEWKKYTFDLSGYCTANNFRIALDGYTNGGLEVIWVDNFMINAEDNAVKGVSASNLNVAGGRGVIFVDNAGGKKVEIYNPAGLRVKAVDNCNDAAIKVEKGVYLVNVDGKSFKVLVK